MLEFEVFPEFTRSFSHIFNFSQDAQEFLRYLLDRLHNELSSNDDGIMTKTFRGILWNQVTCLRCMRVSSKEDPFLDMSLTIPERFVARRNKLEQNLNPCTIYGALNLPIDLFVRPKSDLVVPLVIQTAFKHSPNSKHSPRANDTAAISARTWSELPKSF